METFRYDDAEGYLEMDGIVYPEDVIYADLEENNYGPINYKAASIYNMMKFKRNNE